MVTDYKVVTAPSLSMLTLSVLELVQGGWKPQGGVVAHPIPFQSDFLHFSQAMILPAEAEVNHDTNVPHLGTSGSP